MKDFPKLFKLEGTSNYTMWSFRIHQILKRERVWKLIELVECYTNDTGELRGTSSGKSNTPHGVLGRIDTNVGSTLNLSMTPSTIGASNAAITFATTHSEEKEALSFKALSIIAYALKDTA